MRQPGNEQAWWQGNGRWQRLDSFLTQPGCRWLGWIVLTHSHMQLTHIVIYWRRGERRPWFLATNQANVLAAVRLYRRRMWIEQMFADLKRHGFDLEGSHLRSFRRLSRLTLLAASSISGSLPRVVASSLTTGLISLTAMTGTI